MKSSIKWRLVFLYIMLVSIVMIICGTYIVVSYRQTVQKDVYKNLEENAANAKDIISAIDYNGTDMESYKDYVIKGLSKYTRQNELTFLNLADGEIWYGAEYKGEEQIQLIKKRFINKEAQMIKKNGDSYRVTDLIIHRENNIKYGAYMTGIDYDGDGVIDGILHVAQSMESIDDNINEVIQLIVIAVILSTIVSGLLGLLFANGLTNPIMSLTTSAKKIAQGDLENEENIIEVKSDDEIGELTETFNHMAKELRKTLSQISSEKNKLETVFAHMADGILVFNIEGQLIHANPAAYNMLGLQIADKPFEEIMADKIEGLDFESLLSMDTKEIKTYMLALRENYVNACFASYIDKSNDSIGIITVLQDITEQKKLEEMQKEFVANVSHELRTPITTIKSYAETLLGGAMEDAEIATSFLNVINNESDRMTTLVQDLLELSRLDNKQIKFNMKEMDITKLMMECFEKYQILADKKEQRMTYSDPENNYHIMGDPHRIEQVIKNVISNAVKYSPEGADITMEINAWEDLVEIAIKDTGMGIPDEDLPRIFDRFYRVDKARSRAMGGTGLGLAIVKEIVEHHGGEIHVSSEYGKGTNFYINFPIRKVI